MFWARSKRRYGVETIFHAVKVGEGYMGTEYAERLCQPGTIRSVNRLLPGEPKEEFKCDGCMAGIAAQIARRIRGK